MIDQLSLWCPWSPQQDCLPKKFKPGIFFRDRAPGKDSRLQIITIIYFNSSGVIITLSSRWCPRHLPFCLWRYSRSQKKLVRKLGCVNFFSPQGLNLYCCPRKSQRCDLGLKNFLRQIHLLCAKCNSWSVHLPDVVGHIHFLQANKKCKNVRRKKVILENYICSMYLSSVQVCTCKHMHVAVHVTNSTSQSHFHFSLHFPGDLEENTLTCQM